MAFIRCCYQTTVKQVRCNGNSVSIFKFQFKSFTVRTIRGLFFFFFFVNHVNPRGRGQALFLKSVGLYFVVHLRQRNR